MELRLRPKAGTFSESNYRMEKVTMQCNSDRLSGVVKGLEKPDCIPSAEGV